MTNEPLRTRELRPNHALRSQIRHWQQEQSRSPIPRPSRGAGGQDGAAEEGEAPQPAAPSEAAATGGGEDAQAAAQEESEAPGEAQQEAPALSEGRLEHSALLPPDAPPPSPLGEGFVDQLLGTITALHPYAHTFLPRGILSCHHSGPRAAGLTRPHETVSFPARNHAAINADRS